MNRAELMVHLVRVHRTQGEFQKWTTEELRETHDMAHARQSGQHMPACVDDSGRVECICGLEPYVDLGA